MIEEILSQLNSDNYANYNGKLLTLSVHKSNKENKSYYLQFKMSDFDRLKIYSWFKYLSYGLYDFNIMTAHIHNTELLHKIIIDSMKLDKLYLIS